VAGAWWKPADYGKRWYRCQLNSRTPWAWNVGDKLSFDIAGEPFDVQVASIRKVKWDSFQTQLLRRVCARRAREDRWNLHHQRQPETGDARSLSQLARRFPSVSIFDIDDLLGQVRSVLDKAILAVQSVSCYPVCRADRTAGGRPVQPRRAAL